MIAANGAIARFLEERGFPVMRRVVRSPSAGSASWTSPSSTGIQLPPEPDSKALNDFLVQRRAADPLRFPDLSLAVIKLLGRGEYVASFPGEDVTGHFGLAVTRLHALDRAQPALPGPHHPAAAQGGAGGAARSRTAASALEALAAQLHAEGGRRPEGRAAAAQGGGRLPARRADRRGVRRHRHRRLAQGDLGARP